MKCSKLRWPRVRTRGANITPNINTNKNTNLYLYKFQQCQQCSEFRWPRVRTWGAECFPLSKTFSSRQKQFSRGNSIHSDLQNRFKRKIAFLHFLGHFVLLHFCEIGIPTIQTGYTKWLFCAIPFLISHSFVIKSQFLVPSELPSLPTCF